MMPRARPPQPKPPAFLFYVRDWLSSTLGMARDVKGAYVDLLCWSWDNGPLPDDPRWRQRVIGGSTQTAARLWAALRSRWRHTARGWINPRLERQRRAIADYSARAKKAAQARWHPAAGDATACTEHATSTASRTARRMLRGTLSAPARAVLEPSISVSVSVSEEDQPAAPPPVYAPPFKTYAAIAALALDETPTDDLGAIAETFKSLCARQQIPYDADITRRAIDAVIRSRARRRA